MPGTRRLPGVPPCVRRASAETAVQAMTSQPRNRLNRDTAQCSPAGPGASVTVATGGD